MVTLEPLQEYTFNASVSVPDTLEGIYYINITATLTAKPEINTTLCIVLEVVQELRQDVCIELLEYNATMTVGNEYTITVNVSSKCDTPAYFTLYLNISSFTSHINKTLEPGEWMHVSFTYTPTEQDVGAHMMELNAVLSGDTEVEDNVVTTQVNIIPAFCIRIVSIEVAPENPREGDAVTIKAVVYNASKVMLEVCTEEGCLLPITMECDGNTYTAVLTDVKKGEMHLTIKALDEYGRYTIQEKSITVRKKESSHVPGFEMFLVILAIPLALLSRYHGPK